jgi:hypothetical protein
MDIANFIGDSPVRPRFIGILRTLIVAAAIALICGVSFGATPSNASLSGSYNINFSKVRQASWQKSITCTHNGDKNTFTVGGQSAYAEVDYGVATFDGDGHVSIALTQVHREVNQAESDATVEIACSSSGGYTSTSSGYIVFEAPISGTETGTYSVTSTGSGTITIPGSNGGTLDIDIGGYGSTGIASTILLRNDPSENDQGSGVGVHK